MKKILLSSAVAVLLLTGCGEDKKETTAAATEAKTEVVQKQEPVKVEEKEPTRIEVVTQAAKEASDTVAKAAQDVTNTVSEAAKDVSQKAATIVEEASKEAQDVASKVSEATSDVVKETVEKTQKVVEDVSKEASAVVSSVTTKEETKPSINAQALYASCAGCHVANGEKAALGKSQVIKGWDKQKIIDALNGYKDGSYGGTMKGVMKGQVATKSDAEIEALADLISKF